MTDSKNQFNPEMLVLAREAKGFTQSAVAEVVSFSQSKISKLEDGTLAPGAEDVEILARALERSTDFFFKTGKPASSAVSFYRKTSTLSLTAIKQCNARMNICRLDLQDTIQRTKEVGHSLPYLQVEDYGSPSGVARQLRKVWGLGRGPIPNLTSLAESAGCIVVHFDFGTKKLDGLCLLGEGEIPFIFLNREFPAARMRLTLGHELGHLVMHRAPHEKVEDEAWEFASEFLMPEADISKKFYPATLESLAKLKLDWGVSMQALLKRGETLGKISERYARYLWMQMGKSGYRVQEPYDDQIPREEPRNEMKNTS